MKKYIPVLCIILCINLAGCGKIDNDNTYSVNSPLPSSITSNDQNTTVAPDNKQEETTDITKKEENTANPV